MPRFATSVVRDSFLKKTQFGLGFYFSFLRGQFQLKQYFGFTELHLLYKIISASYCMETRSKVPEHLFYQFAQSRKIPIENINLSLTIL